MVVGENFCHTSKEELDYLALFCGLTLVLLPK